ncbi:hypothetical protein GGG16DRAFT_24639, partial [Schizophyllum commune]
VFPAPRARSHPAGYNALDTNALTLPVRIGSPRGEQTHGRMDSGADITLMSEEFFKRVGTLPPYKEGLRMKLYHLTGSAKVLGFTTFTMYARTKTKELVSFEVEAYVVRDMKVPLLLGEDFHTAYELSVKRHADGSTDVVIGGSGRELAASSSRRIQLGFCVVAQARSQGFTRLKPRRTKRRMRKLESPVRAVEDVIIPPGSVKPVRLEGRFEGRKDWLVERLLIGVDDGDVMAAPLTWVNAEAPCLPIANPGARPRLIKAGEV